MTSYRTPLLAAMLSMGACSVALPLHAQAATVERAALHNGGSACTGALPTFEGALRKRPKAIANEGTSTAFITCSAVADIYNSVKPKRVFAGMTNRGAAPADLTCTFVNGDEYHGSTARPLTVSVAAGAFAIIGWNAVAPATEFDRQAVSISCALPPGMELNYFGQVVDEDVGF